MKLSNFCASAVCLLVLGGTLAGCAPIIIGGAAVGAMVVADRRTSGSQLEDESIELRAAGRVRETLGDRVHVSVTSYNRQVLLTGEVPNAQDKQRVEQIVSRVENVRSIVNELGVTPVTSLTERSQDALITGKVKAAMVDAKDLSVSAFKVLTERGTVYLMGLVTQREAARATDIARSTGGVRKVVRVFEYLKEQDLPRTAPQTTAPKT